MQNQNKTKQPPVGQMIRRCHSWRQKRKQFLDQARQCPDEVERERLLQMAEHYGRIVNGEQSKIDTTRDCKVPEIKVEDLEEEEDSFPDFMAGIAK